MLFKAADHTNVRSAQVHNVIEFAVPANVWVAPRHLYKFDLMYAGQLASEPVCHTVLWLCLAYNFAT